MAAETKIFKNIPTEMQPGWVVMFLEGKNFTSSHIKVLKQLTSVSDKVLAQILNIAPKTLITYTKDVSNAKIDTQEHVLILISLIKHGTEVFGTTESFNKWLEIENILLDHKKPIAFLTTISGIRLIDNRLTSMEYGDNV